jgi:hypothetical protein
MMGNNAGFGKGRRLPVLTVGKDILGSTYKPEYGKIHRGEVEDTDRGNVRRYEISS